MQKQTQQNCQVCSRLGKSQCGYHQYKKKLLQKLSEGFGLKQNVFAQTQSTINNISSRMSSATKNNNRPITPNKQVHVSEELYYPVTSPRPNLRFIQPPSKPQSYCSTPQKRSLVSPQVKPQRMNQCEYMSRREGSQVLYYPIYPVYKVVYESVSSNITINPSGIIPY